MKLLHCICLVLHGSVLFTFLRVIDLVTLKQTQNDIILVHLLSVDFEYGIAGSLEDSKFTYKNNKA